MIVTVTRRFAIAILALGLAATILRPLVSDSLVSRGDEFLRAGELVDARRYYARAIMLDRDSGSATERFTFASFVLKTSLSLDQGIAAATQYLSRHPRAWQIRLNRALALHAAGTEREAAREFLAVAATRHQFEYFALAAHAALRAGDTALATHALAKARALRPWYTPRGFGAPR